MRVAILALGVFLSTGLLAFDKLDIEIPGQVSKSDVTEVYNRLVADTGAPELLNGIRVIRSDEVNAWTDNSRSITLTTAILKTLHNQNELAEVIGHEIGHVLLGHVDDGATEEIYGLDESSTSRIKEANADKFGVYLMLKSGYDICQAKNWFKTLSETEGSSVILNDHPSFAERTAELTFPQCEGK